MKISQNAPPHYITLCLLRFLKDYIQQVNGDRFRRGDFTFWKNMGLFFTQTAFVTVGGSYTVLPYVAHYSVTKLHWLSKLQMIDGFALAETTPGPLIVVLSFVGFMAGYNHFGGSLWMGAAGLLATTYFTFLPCFLMIFAGAPLIEKMHGIEIIEGIPGLITAAVVGVILNPYFISRERCDFPGWRFIQPSGYPGAGMDDRFAGADVEVQDEYLIPDRVKRVVRIASLFVIPFRV